MKRCPICQRTYTDETLKFCRDDGATLVSDPSIADESSATRILPASQTGEAGPTKVLQTDTAQGQGTTSAVETTAYAMAQTGKLRATGSSIRAHRKLVVAGVAGAVLVLAIAGYLYFTRSSRTAIDSIAVLPFANTTGDPNTEYLSDGLTESIINSLTQLPNLRVIPRNSVFRYKGKETDPLAVGKELGVRAVLTGRLLQRGESLTVSTELVDVPDNKQLWGEQYSRKLADALAVQQEISREITDRLRLNLSGEERKQMTARDTSNPEAYQFYLKGRYYWNKRTADNLKKAMEQFQQAADKDPNYALAYVGLADCYVILEEYAGTPASETLPKARAAALRALQIDNSLAEAHTSLAMIDLQSWQFSAAEEEFKRAIALNPNYPTTYHWYNIYLQTMGRHDEAMPIIKRGQQLDPLSPAISANVAQAYFLKGDLEAAVEECKKIIELDPNYATVHHFLALTYQKQGRFSEAIAESEKAVELYKRQATALSGLGYLYALQGQRSQALMILRELEEQYAKHQTAAMYPAAVYVGLGDKDEAFSWLEKDFRAHSGELTRFTFDPMFDSIRSDPRYADLLRRMGLKP